MRGIYPLVIILSAMIAMAITGNFQAEAAEKKAKERLAVLDLEAQHGVEKSLAEALSVIVRDKLHSFGNYEVMSRGDIQAVASREQLKQALGCDDDGSQCLVDFGRAIGTRFMVAGDISKLGATYTVSLRMLDTKGEGAGVKNRVSESCKCDEDALIGTVQDVAAKLVGKPTATAAKKAEEEAKRLADEKNNASAAEQKRLAEERRKEEEKQRLAAEVEKLKKENEQASLEAAQKRVVAESKPAPVAVVASTSPATGKTYTDPTTGMEFVLVPGGCFQMGDTFGDNENQNEKPVHEVCVDAFYMGKYEVTQREYQKVMSNNPAAFQKGDRYPVEQVTWYNTQDFLKKLNGWSGKYRLPTEAEWEYAASFAGGTRKARFGTGKDIIGPDEANFDASEKYKKPYSKASKYREETVAVGSFQPNSLGLYDMSGNVREWCGDRYGSDFYGSDYYKKSPRNNPEGPSTDSYRVLRGGGWYDSPERARTAGRGSNSPGLSGSGLGFRLVLPVQRH